MSENKETTAASLAGPAASNLGLTKYVHVMFLSGAIICGWLLSRIFQTVWTELNLSFTAIPAVIEPVVWVAAGAIALGLTLYLWRNEAVHKLSFEIVVELSKVTWPTRKELYASTIVVIVFSCIAAVVLGLFDFFWSAVTDIWYR
jgi:preprotein translocase subunit SecE